MQPNPVLSLGSDFQSPSFSSQPHLTWWVSRQASRACECWWASILCAGISPLALCTPVAVLSSMALKLPPHLPPSLPVNVHPSVWKLFLLHSSLPEVLVPSLFFCLCFLFLLYLTQVCGDFLAVWEVWGLLPAFNRYSVGIVPHVDVFLIYLWRRRWSPCLTPLPFWRSPSSFFFCLLLQSKWWWPHRMNLGVFFPL